MVCCSNNSIDSVRSLVRVYQCMIFVVQTLAFVSVLILFFGCFFEDSDKTHPAELMFLGILKTIENNRFRSFGWTEIT